MNYYETIFKDAANYITEHGWAQRTLMDKRGRVCLTGAMKECSPQPGDWLIVRAVARYRDHGEGWNDEEGRTQEEVTEWLRSAEPITDNVLAEVFGPQWREIVALVRRAAVLPPEEAVAIPVRDAARDTAWHAATEAARDATWHAGHAAMDAAWHARDAACDAAWHAATDAAWHAGHAARDAACDAATEAARALVVRHLIGHGRFTQECYDELTVPWRKAIGRIHPDDAPVGEGQ